MSVALEMRYYSFRYEDAALGVLQNCNLRVHHGEFLVLCGTSGEGKSTLLMSLAGIIPHVLPGVAEGDILVEGQSMQGKTMAQICTQVGSVLQNADSQIVHSRVEDEIAFGCENMCLPPEEIAARIRTACQTMALREEDATRTLSGGQKQRLVTACTLAMGQKILLLDEPLANLDGESAALVLKTLRALCRQGYAVVLAEHRLDMVLPYADSVACLENATLFPLTKQEALHRLLRPIGDAALPVAPAAKTPCLQMEDACYSVGGEEILKNLNIALYEGQRVVVLGENGGGKTTLLHLLAGLSKPRGGAVVQHMGHFKNKRAWFKAVGYIYQDPAYQLFMPTVEEEVGFGATLEDAAACLRRFGLEALRGRHPQALSEGQKRRLGIAAICATKPRVLLLDEPTVGQDYENLERIVYALNEQHRETGNAMVTVTHDHRCAAALADRVLWLQNGRLYREGGRELVEEYFGQFRENTAGPPGV